MYVVATVKLAHILESDKAILECIMFLGTTHCRVR